MMRSDITNVFFQNPKTMAHAYIIGKASYGEVFNLASRIHSWSLRERKKRGPLCLATSDKASLMAAVLASLAGGPLLVLPASLSDNVISDTCRMVGASAVLSDQPVQLPKGVQSLVMRRKVTDGFAPLEKTAGETGGKLFRRPARRIDEPFLWLYTGGSTGAPKLWPKTPRNIIGEVLNLKSVFAINEKDIFLSTVMPLHIYGLLFSVLLPFVSGARIAGDIPYFPREIITTAARTRCTIFVGSPVHYRALSTSPFSLSNLKLAFSSGGFLEKAHSVYFTRATGAGVVEVYGSTETGGIALRCQAEGEFAWRPFSCVRWRIAGKRLSVSSPFLSPNVRKNKKGFFTTGDRAADSGDGTFVLQGRTDGIVKIGGKRVDLMAIEQKIKSLSSIMDAWVLSLPSKAGRENEIAALVVTEAGLPYLRKAFARVLEPTHMPRLIVGITALPLTPSGKRDHRAALAILSHYAKNPMRRIQ